MIEYLSNADEMTDEDLRGTIEAAEAELERRRVLQELTSKDD